MITERPNNIMIIFNDLQIAMHLSNIGRRKHVQEEQAWTTEIAESVLAVSDLPFQEKRSLGRRQGTGERK